MPVEQVKESEIRITRICKIRRSSEWTDITEALSKEIPQGQSIKVDLTPATVEQFSSREAALESFRFRLNDVYRSKFRIRVVADQIYITHKQ